MGRGGSCPRKVGATVTARYGSTGSGDALEFTTNTANQVQEVTYTLPGGVLLTMRAGGNVWSYPNSHGDIAAVTDQAGAKQGATRIHDPYGNTISGGHTPDNSAGNLDYGWLGQHQRPLEHEPSLQPIIEMGARQYPPLLGRFLETDPIEGGSANDYDYTNANGVNRFDLDGKQVCFDNGRRNCVVMRRGYRVRRVATRAGFRRCNNVFGFVGGGTSVYLRDYKYLSDSPAAVRRRSATSSRGRGGGGSMSLWETMRSAGSGGVAGKLNSWLCNQNMIFADAGGGVWDALKGGISGLVIGTTRNVHCRFR